MLLYAVEDDEGEEEGGGGEEELIGWLITAHLTGTCLHRLNDQESIRDPFFFPTLFSFFKFPMFIYLNSGICTDSS